ncbi:MAG: membrane protein insertase YidC [Helicobacter sp.]|nr:membrane protein insertase YidC [Helicobacter sp.]
MFDKIDNLNPPTRILLVVVLTLLFFVPYSYFYSPTQNTQQNVKSISQESSQSSNNPIIPATSTQEASKNTGEIIATIQAPNFEYQIDRLGRITQAYLKQTKYQKDSNPLPLFSYTSDQNNPKPLEIRFSDPLLNQQSFNTPYHADNEKITIEDNPQTLTLTQTLQGITIKKNITFYPNGYYEITVSIPENYTYFISPGMRPNVESDSYVFKGVIVKESDNTITTIEDGDSDKQRNFKDSIILAGVDRYYTSLFFDPNHQLNAIILNNSNEDPMPFVSASGNIHFSGYIGPKDYKILQNINPLLTDVIEYGIITFFAKPLFLLLDTLYNLTGNWGWAIILLTLIVRIVLYPLTYKGMVSMQKLKDLAPKLKEIQAKYKGDPQKLQAHMMELYKKHGANPMGGCLPLLLQLPVFFAIYRVLYNAIELKGATWILWIKDLSVMDPYFVLPILMAATMFLQQHLTPTNFTDPMQEKVFKFLPIIFAIFCITFPAGLVLYWCVNNIFSILQQLLINKSLERKKTKEITAHKSHQDTNKNA